MGTLPNMMANNKANRFHGELVYLSPSINSSPSPHRNAPFLSPTKKMSSKILQVSRPLRAPAATWRAALVVWRTLGTLGWAAPGGSLAVPGALGVPRRHWGWWMPHPGVGPSWRSLREGPGLKQKAPRCSRKGTKGAII